MSLKEKISKIGISLIGNRVTALGCSMLSGSLTSLALSHEGQLLENHGLSMSLGYVGALLLLQTELGSNTSRLYEKTVNHIKKFGRIEERFFDKVVPVNDMASPWDGYCQLQGVYLAARDYDQLNDFNRMRSKSCNRIPNF